MPNKSHLYLFNRVQKLITSFNKGKELNNIQNIVKSLRETTAGIRLEVSFQNIGSEQLQQAYLGIQRLGDAILSSHFALQDLHKQRYIPIESLRYSPVQIVTTSSIVALAEFQARCLHAMFEKIFKAVIKGKY